MCFNVREGQQLSIAEQDITCLKMMTLRYDKPERRLYLVSYFQDFHYNTAEPEEVDLHVNDQMVHKGYHSYIEHHSRDTDSYFSRTTLETLKDYLLSGYLNPQYKSNNSHSVLVECHIPVGAHFFENEKENEYVSSRIVIDNVVMLGERIPFDSLSFSKLERLVEEKRIECVTS